MASKVRKVTVDDLRQVLGGGAKGKAKKAAKAGKAKFKEHMKEVRDDARKHKGDTMIKGKWIRQIPSQPSAPKGGGGLPK